MARIIAFVPDLLFGSTVLGMISAAGHDGVLASDLAVARIDGADGLIIDLTADPADRLEAVASALAEHRVPTLAFYSHVEADVRAMAEESGIDVVVPRSRMAREGGALIERLITPG